MKMGSKALNTRGVGEIWMRILGKISIYYISIYYNLQEISTVYGVLSECNVQMFNKKKKVLGDPCESDKKKVLGDPCESDK